MVAAHLQKSQEYRKNRDFKAALGEVEQAERLITDKSLNNQEYISVLLHKADVYAYFERLDEAETTLLQATGIPDDKINALTNSRQLITKEQYLAIANELQELVVQDNRSGYHVALSFIYNILGDTQRFQVEQQRAMDVSTTKDTTPAVALGLYKVRQRKLEVHAALEQQKGLAQAEPEKLDLQLQLGYAYYLAGWFAEAQEIADKYMTQVDREKDKDLYILLLSLKMNLAMAQGRYDEMKQYERGILEVDPHALDRFK
jgi:tetratricopeptide (TPR) repeat protein